MKKSDTSRPGPIRKVYVLLCAPIRGRKEVLTENLEALEEVGFEVILVDSSGIFFPHWKGDRREKLSDSQITFARETREILALAAKLSGRDVVIVTGYGGTVLSLQHFRALRALGKSRARIGFIAAGNLPNFSRLTLLRYEIYATLPAKGAKLASILVNQILVAARRFISKVWQVFWKLLKKKYLSLKLDFVWAGVSIPQSLVDLTDEKTTVRYIHNLDFDFVLDNLSSSLFSLPASTVLWLDSMGPFHPDSHFGDQYELRHPELWIDDHTWAIEMIEELFSVDVVVAAHPKSHKDSERVLYGKRKILHNLLYPAILQSQLVISSGSTAIGLVAYAKKPLLLFDSQFEAPLSRALMDSQSRMLDVRKFSRNNPVLSRKVEVCESKYETYVQEYLKRPNTEKSKFWNQVAADLD